MEQTLKNSAVAELHRLLEENTIFRETGFSINLDREEAAWDRALRAIGLNQSYDAMADYVCRRYEQKYAKPFLFSNDCVSYEIKYHLDAYMAVRGFSGYRRHLTTWLLPKLLLRSRCKDIDISARDARDWKQRYIFRYKKGIRDCYKGTPADPFRRRGK